MYTRLSSDKENTLYPTPSVPSSKPRVSGFGRAPRPTTSSSRPKPYSRLRSTSVQRAKRSDSAAPSDSSSTNSITASYSTSENINRAASPSPIKIEPRSPSPEPPLASIQDEVQIPATAPRITISCNGYTAKIPIRLPLPDFPPVADLTISGVETIPAEYVLAKLRPHLRSLFVVASLYRPYPSVPSPGPESYPPYTSMATGTDTYLSNHASHEEAGLRPRRSFAFGIPFEVDGHHIGGKIATEVAGREPDMCIAIRKPGEGTFRLVPIHEMVYASQCSYWMQLTTGRPATTHMEPSLADESYPSVATFPPASSGPLATIPEVPSSPASSVGSFSSNSSVDSLASSATAASESVALEIGPFRHLPLISLHLPSPETFDLIHTHLHTPLRPFHPALLGLRNEQVRTLQSTHIHLSKLSTTQLIERTKIMHGVWKNLCTLGIGNLSTWIQLGESWASVVTVLVIRAAEGGIERVGFPMPPVHRHC